MGGKNNNNKENKEIFSKEKEDLNDIINNKNLISTKENGDIIILNNEACLFKGLIEKKWF